MVVESAPQASSPESAPSADLSAVAGRILDQLNPTAWLPAALLVGDLWLALAYRLSVGGPIDRMRDIADLLNGKPFGILVTTILALVLATIITQSIEFASIRVLEGYWGHSQLAGRLSRIGISNESRRFENLIIKGDRLESQALRSALPYLDVTFKGEAEILKMLPALLLEDRIAEATEQTLPDATKTQRKRLSKFIQDRDWLNLAQPHLVHQISAVNVAARAFPSYDRLLPTRLGQTLRSVEDRLVGVDPRFGLRGYVIRNLPNINPMLLREHDQYRNRLDMYAVMVFAALALTTINPLILGSSVGWVTIFVTSTATITMALVAYRGAVAAAEDYGTALTEVDRQLFAARGRS